MEPKGQSIVETALILPVFFFVTILFMQLIILCHNATTLQQAAARVARDGAVNDASQSRNTAQELMTSMNLLGRIIPPSIRSNSLPFQPWRPFRGISVIRAPGALVNCEIQSALLPRAIFSWVLPLTTLKYSAEFPKEPPVPAEE